MRCSTCAARYYPGPLLCAACGGARLRPVRATQAHVEEVTTLRPAAGADEPPRRLATVRTDDGVRLVARLLDDSGPGAVVVLLDEGGAVLGRGAQ